MRLIPEAAGTICSPCGPVTMASSSAHSPLTTCPMWKRVCSPSKTSTLANPRSASTSMTSRPWAAIDTARLADTVVLPTPPLPPVTAITLTGRVELSCSRASACARASRLSRMGACSAEVADVVGIVARRGLLLELERGAHQPHPALVGGMQVLGHPLSVADIGDSQFMAQRRRNHRAQTGRLVHLGQNAGMPGRGCARRPATISSSAWPSPCAGSASSTRARAAPELQAASCSVNRTSRGPMPAVSIRISFFDLQAFEHLRELLAAVGRVHRRAENARVSHELLASADSIGIGAHQRQVLAAVPHAPTRGELGDGRGLAGARRADDGDDAAVHACSVDRRRAGA